MLILSFFLLLIFLYIIIFEININELTLIAVGAHNEEKKQAKLIKKNDSGIFYFNNPEKSTHIIFILRYTKKNKTKFLRSINEWIKTNTARIVARVIRIIIEILLLFYKPSNHGSWRTKHFKREAQSIISSRRHNTIFK